MAPVCSPTAIICVTMPGNTSLSFSGSVSDLPSSSDFLTFCKALSTTALPAVFAVMSSPSRMGTPLEMSVPSVRVNRATAIFLIRRPKTDNRHQNQEPEDTANEIAQSNDDLGGQRKVDAQAGEQSRKNRYNLPEQQ